MTKVTIIITVIKRAKVGIIIEAIGDQSQRRKERLT